jgi:hypothetical protein
MQGSTAAVPLLHHREPLVETRILASPYRRRLTLQQRRPPQAATPSAARSNTGRRTQQPVSWLPRAIGAWLCSSAGRRKQQRRAPHVATSGAAQATCIMASPCRRRLALQQRRERHVAMPGAARSTHGLPSPHHRATASPFYSSDEEVAATTSAVSLRRVCCFAAREKPP